jgi:hypothetical protein
MFGEWYRSVHSKIELTLRTPFLLLSALTLFVTRSLPKWILAGFLVWYLTKSIFIAIIVGFVLALLWEMVSLYDYYIQVILPKHLKNLVEIEKMSEVSKNGTTTDLINNIEKATKLSTWGLVNIVYAGIASWGYEIVFKFLYPFLVNLPRTPYYNLLIGFPNKNIDADQLLWEIAQENNPRKATLLLKSYLRDFGSKINDIDLKEPTLREKPEAVQSLVKLYKNISSPEGRRRTSAKKREKTTEQVFKKLRIPKKLFQVFLSPTQKNTSLREDRRHYAFLPDYYIRQMLIELGSRIGFINQEVFNKSWGEIKHEATRKRN